MKDLFVDGAVNKGHSREKVSKLFDDMEEFSRYSFCLAHKKNVEIVLSMFVFFL